MRLRREKRLVHVDLGINVDWIVADVEKLDDLGLRELLDDTFPARKFFLELARVLNHEKTVNTLIFKENEAVKPREEVGTLLSS